MSVVIFDRENRDLGLEHSLLYHLIKNPRRSDILGRVFPALFSDDENKALFTIIRELKDEVSLLSVAMLHEERNKRYRQETLDLFSTGQVPYLAEGETPEELIKQLKLLFFRRISQSQLTRIANVIEHGIPADGEAPGNIFDEVSKLLQAESRLVGKSRSSIEEIAKKVAERINTTSDVIKTGFPFLNSRTGGLTRRQISSLLAMPGHGKSLFSDSLMYQTLMENPEYTGLIISLEDPIEERVKRMVAARFDISLADMRFKKIQVPESDILMMLKVELGNRLQIIDTRDITKPDEAAAAISDIKPSLCIVDHIQNFHLSDMIQGLIEAARVLEVASMRADCHTMICCQVPDKQLSKRDDPQPTASDVQWTSTIRQKSAEMFSLYYQYQDTFNPMQQSLMRLRILKARFASALGLVNLHIDPDKGRIIKEMTKNYEVPV